MWSSHVYVSFVILAFSPLFLLSDLFRFHFLPLSRLDVTYVFVPSLTVSVNPPQWAEAPHNHIGASICVDIQAVVQNTPTFKVSYVFF